MNTGELTTIAHPGGMETVEPIIWCDICGWPARDGNDPDARYHFCHRHKGDDVRRFMDGSLVGYFEKSAQIDLPLEAN